MSSAVGFTAEGYRSLSTATYALVGAASATSYVLYTQVGLSQGGVIPLLQGTLAPSVRISSADKVKIWRGFYNAAKVRSTDCSLHPDAGQAMWTVEKLTSENGPRGHRSRRPL